MAGLSDIVVGNYTKLYYAADATAVEITNVQTLTHPTDERTIVEVPEYNRTYPRKLLGGASTGNCEIVVNYDASDTSHKYMNSLYSSGAQEAFKIEVNDALVATETSFYLFTGRVASKSAAGEFDSTLTVTYSIAIDGAIGEWMDVT